MRVTVLIRIFAPVLPNSTIMRQWVRDVHASRIETSAEGVERDSAAL